MAAKGLASKKQQHEELAAGTLRTFSSSLVKKLQSKEKPE